MKLLITALFLLAALLPAAACADHIVGADIAEGDITEFCCVCATSTDPPLYQRYRFFTEDGQRYFEHERREGGGWPQTEADITASGTVALTDTDWAALMDCLRGGRVDSPDEEVLDGDDGPWMSLYWPGDGGTERDFRFASPAERRAFETLCDQLARGHVLTRLWFTRGGYMMPQSWEVTLEDGRYLLREDDGEPRALAPELAAELRGVIGAYGLESWDGFDETNPYVLDGEGFWLELDFADGTTVAASGENAFPDHYHDATDGIEEVFDKEKKARLAGTYRYEGEGFGGDFTVTLNADGTYTFYEGMLSSYLGGGTWSVFYNAVYMNEENGFDLKFTFGVEDGALIYFAAGSDPFPYVKVSDGERFIAVLAEEADD